MIPELPLLVAVGFFAGVCNAVVGGGTLFTFPVLIAAGISPILANTTTTVALLPGTLTSAFAYLPQLSALRRRAVHRARHRGLTGRVCPDGRAIMGGYCGARLARHLSNLWLRRVVTAAGAFFSLYYFVKAYG
jgi:uncharacterized membrane protein YfcA